MNEIEVIKYLLEEIEEEQKYNTRYELARSKAREEVKSCNNYYWDNMPKEFNRQPRKSVIKANAVLIRRILMKLYKEKEA